MLFLKWIETVLRLQNKIERITRLDVVRLSLNLSKQSMTWRNYHSQIHEKVVVL